MVLQIQGPLHNSNCSGRQRPVNGVTVRQRSKLRMGGSGQGWQFLPKNGRKGGKGRKGDEGRMDR